MDATSIKRENLLQSLTDHRATACSLNAKFRALEGQICQLKHEVSIFVLNSPRISRYIKFSDIKCFFYFVSLTSSTNLVEMFFWFVSESNCHCRPKYRHQRFDNDYGEAPVYGAVYAGLTNPHGQHANQCEYFFSVLYLFMNICFKYVLSICYHKNELYMHIFICISFNI